MCVLYLCRGAPRGSCVCGECLCPLLCPRHTLALSKSRSLWPLLCVHELVVYTTLMRIQSKVLLSGVSIIGTREREVSRALFLQHAGGAERGSLSFHSWSPYSLLLVCALDDDSE